MIATVVVILLSGSVSGLPNGVDEYNLGPEYFPPAPEGDWYVYDVAGVISDETYGRLVEKVYAEAWA